MKNIGGHLLFCHEFLKYSDEIWWPAEKYQSLRIPRSSEWWRIDICQQTRSRQEFFKNSCQKKNRWPRILLEFYKNSNRKSRRLCQEFLKYSNDLLTNINILIFKNSAVIYFGEMKNWHLSADQKVIRIPQEFLSMADNSLEF